MVRLSESGGGGARDKNKKNIEPEAYQAALQKGAEVGNSVASRLVIIMVLK